MLFNFYRFDLHNKTHIASKNLRWNICKNRIENWTSLGLVMIVGMFVDFLVGYIDPSPNCIHCKCRVVINIWKSPISFKHVVFVMFALWSSPNHIPIKSRSPIKKTSHLRPIYCKAQDLHQSDHSSTCVDCIDISCKTWGFLQIFLRMLSDLKADGAFELKHSIVWPLTPYYHPTEDR